MEPRAAGVHGGDWRRLAVSLTSRCNLRCKMCPVVRGEPASLTAEQVLDVVDFAESRGFECIALSGGEPTILSYFWELLERLGRSPLAVEVLTNAFGVGEGEVVRLAAHPNVLVHVSVDGVGAVHDAIRGKGSFAAAAGCVAALLEGGGRCSITTTVQRTNFRTMVDVYEYFKDWGLEWHAFNFADPFWGDLELIPAEDLTECFDALAEVCRRNNAEGGHATISEAMLGGLRTWLRYPGLALHPGRDCTIPMRMLAVGETGVVRPCWHYGWETGRGRNINERPLRDIVDDPAYAEEVARAIGPGGCRGCSAMCYLWDEDFSSKMLHPNGGLRLRRAALHAKEYLRQRHHRVFEGVKGALGLLRK